MRVVKYIVPIIIVSLISVGLIGSKTASAMTPTLECNSPHGLTTFGCDLAIYKQVSVGSAAFTNAPTAATAVPAQIGDTVTWQITISNDSLKDESLAAAEVGVQDLLPSGVTYDSYTATDGTYSNVIGEWDFSLTSKAQPVLTIVTTANATGVIENTASIVCYMPCPQQDYQFADFNQSNNSASAFINVQAPAVAAPPTATTTTTTTAPSSPAAPSAAAVLPAATTTAKAPDTGFSVKDMSVGGTILSYGLVTTALAGAAFKFRTLAKFIR